MTATHSLNSTRSLGAVLYLSFELSSNQWKIASTTARGQKARVVSMPARDMAQLLREIARAKVRFGLPRDAAVFSCYEAGRDGFWLDRFLHQFWRGSRGSRRDGLGAKIEASDASPAYAARGGTRVPRSLPRTPTPFPHLCVPRGKTVRSRLATMVEALGF
jgi:hypothetical protein